MSLGRSLLIGCLWTCPVVADDALDLARWAPPDSYLVLTWQGADAAAPAFQRSQLGQLWAEPQVQQFIHTPLRGGLALLRQASQESDEAETTELMLDLLGAIWHRPTVLCAFPVDPVPDGWRHPDAGALVCDLGEQAETIARRIIELDEKKHGALARKRLAGADFAGEKKPDAILTGWLGARLILALGEGAARKVAEHLASEKPGFSTAPAHIRVARSMKAFPSALYLNVQTTILRDRLVAMARASRDSTGLSRNSREQIPWIIGGLTGLSMLQGNIGGRVTAITLGFEDEQLRTTWYAEPDPQYPLPADFLRHQPIDPAVLRHVPADVMSAVIVSSDFSSMYKGTLVTVERIAEDFGLAPRPATEPSDESSAGGSAESSAGASRETASGTGTRPAAGWLDRRIRNALGGFDPQEDLLRYLGSHVAYYECREFAGASLNLLLQLTDAAAFSKQVDAWIAKLPADVRFRPRQVGQRTLHSLDVSGLGLQLPPMALSPCYAIADDILLISTSTAACTRYLSALDKKDQKSLLDREDVQKFLAEHKNEQVCSLSLYDEKATHQVIYPQVAMFYPMITSILIPSFQRARQAARDQMNEEARAAGRPLPHPAATSPADPAEGAPSPAVEFAPLPDFDVVHRHMLSTISYTRIEGEARIYDGRSGVPLTGGSAMVATSGTLVAILLPSLARARELSKRTVCAANLKLIGTAMYEHAIEHDDEFPASLKDMRAKELVTGKTLICPSSEDTEEDKDISYVWIAGQTSDVDQRNVVAYEPKDNHGGEGANVLFADGHVEFVKPYEKVEALVEETKKRLAAKE